MRNCDTCEGDCCKYVCVEIDTPETKEDFEEIMWYVAHKNVWVYQDHEDDWYVEFKTECDYLENTMCQIHPHNPNNKTGLRAPYVCLEHSSKDCEADDGDPYQLVFKTVPEVVDYMKKKFPKANFNKFKFVE